MGFATPTQIPRAVTGEMVQGRLAARVDQPFHESMARLRALDVDYPRNYAITWMHNEPRRRWWPLGAAIPEGRLEVMHRRALRELGSRDVATGQVASMVIHAVVARLVALLVLEGRAWDPGTENLWLHYDSDGGVDWTGVVDPMLRVLPGDPAAGARVVRTLPCEAALLMWVAHRCETTLDPLLNEIARFSGVNAARLWAMVGEAVMGMASYAPARAGVDDAVPLRRARALLGAFEELGRPVRSHSSSVRLRWGSLAVAV
ncbi:hypothetical protein [Lolliginicoccus levis]|uniref:hypothetical protein n=1 Tax=Lolliginicoccus levis TaxID=2919542 RepID=UPI00241DC836|nr:hypothetical protein [Lolliginicoccus levis]